LPAPGESDRMRSYLIDQRRHGAFYTSESCR
jgi:hypothetical protein